MLAEIIRPRSIPIITGLSRSTIWRLEKEGKFPQRVRLSAGAVGYYRSQIETWLAQRQVVTQGESAPL